MTLPLTGVPIKPFGVAKARLAPALDRAARSRLGRRIATRTLETVAATGAHPAVVTADRGVAAWAVRHGWAVVEEPAGGGLDGAAAALVAAAGGRPWAVLHADLPMLAPSDLEAAWAALASGPVLSPSHDGGTSFVAAHGPAVFSYGAGSFHRHLRRLPRATVLVRPGLALDLDTVADLVVAMRLAAGQWLGETRQRVTTGRPPVVP